MSKKTLEAELLGVQPTPQRPSFDATYNTYWTQHEKLGASVRKLMTMNGVPDLKRMHGDWESLPFMIGSFHRMITDHHHPLVDLGMTRQQEADFQDMCVAIRAAVTTHVAGGTARTTPTKALYDQVKSLGF